MAHLVHVRFSTLCILGTLWLIASGCAGIAAPSVESQPVRSSADQWPIEGRVANRGRATAEDIAPPLMAQDEYAVGGDTQLVSPATVAQDLLFAEGARKLHVLGLVDGKERWQINLAGSFLSPAVDGERVIVRAESGDDGYIYTLAVEDGTKLWQFRFPAVGSQYDNIGGRVTSPVVVDDLVLVAAAQTLFALDAVTGDQVWRADLQQPVASSAAVADQTVYVADFTHLYAFDLKTGKELWQFGYDTVSLMFAPIVAEGRVVVTSGDEVHALDRQSGELLWTQEFSGTAVIPAASADDQIYVKSVNELVVLDAATGARAWQYAVGDFVSLPAVTAAHVYVLTRESGEGQVRALNRHDGVEVWKTEVSQLANAAPVAAGGAIYVRTVDGRILAYGSAKE